MVLHLLLASNTNVRTSAYDSEPRADDSCICPGYVPNAKSGYDARSDAPHEIEQQGGNLAVWRVEHLAACASKYGSLIHDWA